MTPSEKRKKKKKLTKAGKEKNKGFLFKAFYDQKPE